MATAVLVGPMLWGEVAAAAAVFPFDRDEVAAAVFPLGGSRLLDDHLG